MGILNIFMGYLDERESKIMCKQMEKQNKEFFDYLIAYERKHDIENKK